MLKIQKAILTLMALLLLSSVGYGADWKYVSTSADGDLFYDTQSISREQNTVKVWTKIVLSDKAKPDFKRKFQIAGENPDNDKTKRAESLRKIHELKSKKI